MEIPDYEPFYLDTPEALGAEIRRLGLQHIPLDPGTPHSADRELLGSPLPVPGTPVCLPNRFCSQPLTGHDARPGTGCPGELTLRRYRRYAQGGFGLVWVESTLAGPCDSPGSRLRLQLHPGSVGTFRQLVRAIKDAAPASATILQLANPPLPSPDEPLTGEAIESARAALLQGADLAAEAGFDGIDLQACGGSLASALLGRYRTGDPHGDSLEQRAGFLRETLGAIRERQPGLLLATRLCAFDAARGGFGVNSADFRKPAPDEPVRLVRLLREAGCLDLLNVTAASPNLTGSPAERPHLPRSDLDKPDEHPLMALDRLLWLAGLLRAAAPGLPVVGSGWSWLRGFLPAVAAGAIREGLIDVAGLGRSALACPGLPRQVLGSPSRSTSTSTSTPTSTSTSTSTSTCMVCFACGDLLRDGAQPVGCVIRDGEIYGPAYQQARRFAPDRLAAEARRCHLCEAAPCAAACPAGIDIPGCIRAFLAADHEQAWEIIRAADVLPETTSRLSAGWLHREGACIETALTGAPVAVADLLYAVSWRARDRERTGVRLPEGLTGRQVAVVGGGPAGVAAAIRLLEQGQQVELFERSSTLGGTPEQLIPASRFTGSGPEIEAVLSPALAAGRLRIHFGCSVGTQLSLAELRTRFDAVLLATGLWRERPLLPAGQTAPDGVLDALAFLGRAKRGAIASLPPRVAVLSGGDCAMDAARTARELGAREVFIVFGGPRAAMHWHMPEGWFASPGVHALMHCQPVRYDTGADGKLRGIRVRHGELGTEGVLQVEMAIEAMGLGIEEPFVAALAALGVGFTRDGLVQIRSPGSLQTHATGFYAAGALVNGGDTVARCVAEGMRAADEIGRDVASAAGTASPTPQNLSPP